MMRQLIDAIRYGAKAEGVTLGIYVAALFFLLYMVIDYVKA